MKKKILVSLMTLAMLVPYSVPSYAAELNDTIIYVNSEADSSVANGSIDAPFSSIAQAKEYIRTINTKMTSDITVEIAGGRYYLDDTLKFNHLDSGKNGYEITYKGAENEVVEISGGVEVTGWEYDEENNIYYAKAPEGFDGTRGFYVNGEAKKRARSNTTFTNSDYVYFDTATDEQKTGDHAHKYSRGYKTTDTFLKDYQNKSDMEVVLITRYRSARCMVEDIADGENGYVNVLMAGSSSVESDWSEIDETPYGWYNVVKPSGTQSVDLYRYPLYYENAYELLDEPGEWYYNKTNGYVYYMPEENEEITDAVFGNLEQLVTLQGTDDMVVDFSKVVRNISFENVNFCHTDWEYLDEKGGVYFEQATTIKTVDTKKAGVSFQNEFPVAAVTVQTARNIDFSNCTFKNLSMNAINMTIGVQNCTITDCVFEDIGGNAINCGEVANMGVRSNNSYYKYDAEDNYNPNTATKLNRAILINNNEISKVGQTAIASVGIATGYLVDSEVSNNYVHDVPYSGLHIGWGWNEFEEKTDAEGNVTQAARDVITRNLQIKDNHISNAMDSSTVKGYKTYVKQADGSFAPFDSVLVDGGSIYFFGKTSGSEAEPNDITGNYMEKQKSSMGYIYADSGAGYWNIYNNVIDARKSDAPWYNPPGQVRDGAPYWLMLASKANDLNLYDNYSTTNSIYTVMTSNTMADYNISLEEPTIHANAGWAEKDSAIIENAGIRTTAKSLSSDNLIFNGAFDSDAAIWNKMSDNVSWADEDGNGVLAVTGSAIQETMLDANTEYIMTAKVKASAGASAKARISVTDADDMTTSGAYYTIYDDAWRTVYLRYTGANEYARLAIETDAEIEYYIDDVSVVKSGASKVKFDEIVNYGFENFENGVIYDMWKTHDRATMEMVDGAAGSKGAVKLTQTSDVGVGLIGKFAFEAGKTYKLSALVKLGDETKITEDYYQIGTGNPANVNVCFEVGSTSCRTDTMANAKWQKVEATYNCVAGGIEEIKIMPAKNGYRAANGMFVEGDTAEFYFDDICISEVLEEEVIDVTSDALNADEFCDYDTFSADELSSGWMSMKDTNATISRDDMVGPDGREGVMKCVITTSSGARRKTVTFEKGKYYELSVWAKAENVSHIGSGKTFNFYFKETSNNTYQASHHKDKMLTTEWQQMTFLHKQTDETATVTVDLYQEVTGATTVYFDDFCIREIGAEIYDAVDGNIGIWNVSNSNNINFTRVADESRKPLEVNISKVTGSPVLRYAFEVGKTYELSAWIKTDGETQLGNPAIDIKHAKYTKNNSTRTITYNEAMDNSWRKKVQADKGFGANENWQKFVVYYSPTAKELTDAYEYSKLMFIVDNVAYATGAETDITYYLDGFTVREYAGNASENDGKIKIETEYQQGKLYHIMQAAADGVYASVDYGISGDSVVYNSTNGFNHKAVLIELTNGVATKIQNVVLDMDEKTFTIDKPLTATLEQLESGIVVEATNTTEDTEVVTVVTAVYKDGNMTEVKTSQMVVPSGYITARSAKYAGDCDMAKVMVMDGENILKPVERVLIAE